jgi:hypothetical protein
LPSDSEALAALDMILSINMVSSHSKCKASSGLPHNFTRSKAFSMDLIIFKERGSNGKSAQKQVFTSFYGRTADSTLSPWKSIQ